MLNIFKKFYFRLLILINFLVNNKFLKKLMVNRVTKNGIELKFQINNIITLNRSIYYYENETLDWINTFNKDEVFWDIGACTGVYSILASKKNLKSFAFEVDYPTYKLCKKNFELNKVNEFSKVYNILIGEETRLVNIDINNITAISKTPIINLKNDNLVMSYTLDDLMNFKGFEKPNYIKIDVERTEDKLFKGGEIFFKQSSIKSILVEISKNNYDYISNFLKSKNFKLTSKFDQGSGDANYIFTKI